MIRPEGDVNPERVSLREVVGIALCGGLGKRLVEVTRGEIPKPLVKVRGTALIDYSLVPLYSSGIRRFIFCVSDRSEQIIGHVSEIRRTKLNELEANFSCEKIPMGIAAGVRQALETFNIDSDVAVFDTDALRLGLDFQDAYRFHRTSGSITTLVCGRVPRLKDSQFAVFDDNSGETALVVLHPEGVLLSDTVIKCGMMICSPRATRFIREAGDIENSWIGLLDYLSLLGKMRTYITPNLLFYLNVNTPAEHEEAESLLAI